MTHAILVSGEPIYCAARVENWHDTGLAFPARAKRTQTRAVVVHWTGGVGDAKQVHRTLTDRGLSVHFVIDEAGVCWQMLDADRVGAHAGGPLATLSANPWSIGIEIVCPGTRAVEGWPLEVERIHGRAHQVSQYRPAQVEAARHLCEALCRAYGLPLVAPSRAASMSRAELAEWRGLLGHLHVTPSKRDPGARILGEIVRAA